MSLPLKYCLIHCTATPAGAPAWNADRVRQLHLGPREVRDQDGRVQVVYKGQTYDSRASLPDESIADIHISRLNGFGWSRVGYSHCIEYDGRIVELHPLNLSDGFQPFEVTYHAAELNRSSIGIVYVGGLSANGQRAEDTRTDAQKASLLHLVERIRSQVPHIQFAGHNQFHNKWCPSFWVPAWLRAAGVPEANMYSHDPFGYGRLLG